MAVVRGVTGPLAQDEAVEASEQDNRDNASVRHHRLILWIPWTLIAIGVWLVLAPFTLGYLTDASGRCRRRAAGCGSATPPTTSCGHSSSPYPT